MVRGGPKTVMWGGVLRSKGATGAGVRKILEFWMAISEGIDGDLELVDGAKFGRVIDLGVPMSAEPSCQ